MKTAACALVALLLCAGAAGADDEAVELARIKQERTAAEARFEAARRACEQRFAVTPCVDEARAERRAALQALRVREADIDSAQRKRRAAQRQEAIRAKVEAQAARDREAPASAPATRLIERRAPVPAARDRAAASAPDAAARAASEAKARSAHEARVREIDRHRAEVERRNAKRAQGGKAAAPLPLPASAPR